MVDVAVNWWAVLAAAVAYMVIGYLWYGPLFGKTWMKLMGFSEQGAKPMPMKAMTLGLVSALVMAYVLTHFVVLFGAFDTSDAWQLAFWTWLGFIATTQVGVVLWEGKSWKLFFLNTIASLISVFAMACILVRWG